MTFIKIERQHTSDERWIEAGPDAFAVHVAALTYCDQQLTDGRISHAMATRVSLAVPSDRTGAAIEALVACNFWVLVEAGNYIIDNYLDHAFPAAQIMKTRGRWKNDKDRRRQHDNGDHSLCKDPKFCPAIRSTPDSTVDSTSGGSRLYQTQPDQTQPDRREGLGFGRGEADQGGSAGATPPDGPEGDPDWTKWPEVELAHRFVNDPDHPERCQFAFPAGTEDNWFRCGLPAAAAPHGHPFKPTQYPHDMTCDFCSGWQTHPIHPNRRECFSS